MKLKPEAPRGAPLSIKATSIAQTRATAVATTIATAAAAAADAAGPVRRTYAVFQAIAIPGRIAQTTGGRTITKDRRAAAAMATTTQGAGLGHPLGMRTGIAVGVTIKIKIMEEVAGSKIAIRTAPGDRTGAIAKCPVMKA